MSLSRLVWTMTRILRRLWVRASLYCLVAIATALAAIWIGPILPAAFPSKVGAKAVDAILSIIASSMLAVTTFSLSTLVAATSAAASSATPRATSLLLEDATSQRALSTFLGAFLFSLVGLIALNTELYDDGGRFVLFVATLGLVAIIVVTLLRWIDHLAGLGHMGETIGRVEKAATEAYRAHTHAPFLGGTPAETVPEGAIAIRHKRIGYVQHLDMGALSTVADEADGDIYVTRRPGHYCDPAKAHRLDRPPRQMRQVPNRPVSPYQRSFYARQSPFVRSGPALRSYRSFGDRVQSAFSRYQLFRNRHRRTGDPGACLVAPAGRRSKPCRKAGICAGSRGGP